MTIDHLREIESYVATRAQVPTGATWDQFFDNDSETINFRLADRTNLPFRGYVVRMDGAEAGMKRPEVIGELVGEVFLEVLRTGLPDKEPGEPYPSIRI